jgi:hypothetical protein
MWLRGVPNARMGFSSWILQTKTKNAFTTGGMAIVLHRDYAWWTRSMSLSKLKLAANSDNSGYIHTPV